VVAPVENLTRVSGVVTERSPHPELPDWDLVTLLVDRAEAVPGRADLVSGNLLSAGQPSLLPVAVRRELLGAAPVGARLTCRVKFTPNGAMAEPHPAEGDFVVDPPEPAQG
jgi:hypothetical protein